MYSLKLKVFTYINKWTLKNINVYEFLWTCKIQQNIKLLFVEYFNWN